MKVFVSEGSKGFSYHVHWGDGTQVSSQPYPDKVTADRALAEYLAPLHNRIRRDAIKTLQKLGSGLVAIALILPLAMPALAHRASGRYVPPDNGGPTTSQPTGSR